MLIVKQFLVGGLDKNFAYIIYDDVALKAVIVDPSGDMSAIYSFLEERSLSVSGCIVTHTHADHFDALGEFLERYSVPVYVHAFGVAALTAPQVKPVEDEMELQLGACDITVLHTPGHSLDAICLYIDQDAAQTKSPQLITGDTLFVEGCGRTTAEQVKTLYDSLERLKALPEETVIYPGHNYGSTPTSTLARELQHNRYLTAQDFDTFRARRLLP